MPDIEKRLKQLSHSLAYLALYSEDIYWMSDASFNHSLYLSPAYEKIFYRSGEPIKKNLKLLDQYILPEDIKHRNPFVEISRRIREEGPDAYFHEKVRMVKADGEIAIMEDRGQPVFDEFGQCIAITGVSREITHLCCIQTLQIPQYHACPLLKKQRYYLRGKYWRIYLTAREAEFSFHLLQGKTAKQIAKIVQVSPRTVESALDQVKSKFNIRYRSQLFEALLEGCFLECIF